MLVVDLFLRKELIIFIFSRCYCVVKFDKVLENVFKKGVELDFFVLFLEKLLDY